MSKNTLLCSFLCVQTCSCVCSLYSFVHKLVLTCVYLFFSLCSQRFHLVYACRTLHTQYLSCTRMAPGSSLDTLSQGTLCQLMGTWKFLEVSFSPFSLVGHAFSFLQSYIHMPHRIGLCTIFLPTTFLPISCKLLPYQIRVLQTVPYLILANYHLVNWTITFCKLLFLNLANCYLEKLLFLNLANYHLANCYF